MKLLLLQASPLALPQAGQTPASQASGKEQLLAQLHDVIPPEPVSWWPPAIGWWVLALLFLCTLAIVVFKVRQHLQQNRYRQQALQLVKELTLNESLTTSQYTKAISTVLKRCFFTAYPKYKTLAARSYGEDWHQLLIAALPTNTPPLQVPWSTLLYAKRAEYPKQDLHDFAVAWIKKHRKTIPLETHSPEANHVSV